MYPYSYKHNIVVSKGKKMFKVVAVVGIVQQNNNIRVLFSRKIMEIILQIVVLIRPNS